MSSPAKQYAMKILMANVHVDDKELFKQGLEEIFYPTSPEESIIIEQIVGNAPEGLNSLEKIANAINNDIAFFATINKELEQKITKEEFVALLEENLPAMTENEILDICK